MHRILCLILCLTLLPALFTGCQTDPTADELAYAILNLFPSLPSCTQYVKGAEPYTTGYLPPEEFSLLYLGKRTVLPEWEALRDCRILLSNGTDGFELHVLRANSSAEAVGLGKLLEQRAAMLRRYNRTDPAYPVAEPVVFVRDCYAVLAVTEDNEGIARLLKKRL